VALPRLRLPRARIAEAMGWMSAATAAPEGARAVCNWDEDAVTLAVEAARGALADEPRVDAVWLASTTLPFADRDVAALVAAALDLPATTETLCIGASLRSGTSALARALARPDRRTLVIATDARRAAPGSPQELTYGHGAAAFVTGPPTRGALAGALGIATRSADFVDHYRAPGEAHDYALEDRWVREEGWIGLVPEVIARALASSDTAASEVSQLVVTAAGAVARRIAAEAGLTRATPADVLHADCGDTGAAHPLLMLAAALERSQPGELIAVVGFGQGVDVLLLRTGEGVARRRATVSAALGRRVEEPHYARHLSHAGHLEVDFGMRAERDQRSAHTVAWRRGREIDGFVGGRCRACGAVQFPRFRVCANPECRATDTLDPHRLADSAGRVRTFTEDWQAYSPRPPYVYGNVAFDEGGSLFMEFTDLEPGEIAVGDAVRFVFRVKDIDRARHFRRYFWKAVRN
jgi:3-hydroxy-3-methylglutaryl CoA synthase